MSVAEEYIDMAESVYVTHDGQALGICALFDAEGKQCDPAAAAWAAVGPDKDGQLWMVSLTDFENVVMQ